MTKRMKGWSFSLRVSADARDEDNLVDKLSELFDTAPDWISGWEIDWRSVDETGPNFVDDDYEGVSE